MKISFLLVLLILLLGKSPKAQVINISTCAELQNLELNNNTIVYNLTDSISCFSNLTTIGDNSSFFQGRIEGNSFSINHLIISSPFPFIGLFGFGKDCILRNLFFKNLSIDATNKVAGGALFANCTNCKIIFFF